VLIVYYGLLEALERLQVALAWGQGTVREKLNLLRVLHS
jgi:hypothetical protein